MLERELASDVELKKDLTGMILVFTIYTLMMIILAFNNWDTVKRYFMDSCRSLLDAKVEE